MVWSIQRFGGSRWMILRLRQVLGASDQEWHFGGSRPAELAALDHPPSPTIHTKLTNTYEQRSLCDSV